METDNNYEKPKEGEGVLGKILILTPELRKKIAEKAEAKLVELGLGDDKASKSLLEIFHELFPLTDTKFSFATVRRLQKLTKEMSKALDDLAKVLVAYEITLKGLKVKLALLCDLCCSELAEIANSMMKLNECCELFLEKLNRDEDTTAEVCQLFFLYGRLKKPQTRDIGPDLKEMQEIMEKMQKEMEEEKKKTRGRKAFGTLLGSISSFFGGASIGSAIAIPSVSAIVSAPVLGGSGVLLLGSVSVAPPVAIAVGAIAVGLVAAAGIFGLIEVLYMRKNRKIEQKLTKLQAELNAIAEQKVLFEMRWQEAVQALGHIFRSTPEELKKDFDRIGKDYQQQRIGDLNNSIRGFLRSVEAFKEVPLEVERTIDTSLLEEVPLLKDEIVDLP